MKKLIIMILVFSFLSQPVHAGTWKLVTGLVLVGGGTFFTVNGFKKINVKDKEWNTLIYEYHEDWWWDIWWAEYHTDPYPESIEFTWWKEDWSGFPGDYNYYLYNRHRTYKEETNSTSQGVIGIVMIVGGTYLIIDYLVGLGKIKEKVGIEFQYVRQQNTDYILCSKSF